VCPEGKRVKTDWILPPFSWIVTCQEFDTNAWFSMLRTVAAPECQDCGSSAMAEIDSSGFYQPIWNFAQVFGEEKIKTRSLRRK
jgi:hypothetical protein